MNCLIGWILNKWWLPVWVPPPLVLIYLQPIAPRSPLCLFSFIEIMDFLFSRVALILWLYVRHIPAILKRRWMPSNLHSKRNAVSLRYAWEGSLQNAPRKITSQYGRSITRLVHPPQWDSHSAYCWRYSRD